MTYTIIFILVILVSAFHLFWESIIAPSIRKGIRYKVFRTRDQIRRLKIESPDEFDRELFYVLQNHANILIKHGSRLNLMFLHDLKQMHDDPEVIARSEKNKKLIADCKNEEVLQAVRDLNQCFAWFVTANVGGWMIYVIPIALICYFVSKLHWLIIDVPSKSMSRIIEENDEFTRYA